MRTNSKNPWKRRRRPHAQLHLPPLSGHEALLVAEVLKRMADAIWRAHGDTMGDILYGRGYAAEHSTLSPIKPTTMHTPQQFDIDF